MYYSNFTKLERGSKKSLEDITNKQRIQRLISGTTNYELCASVKKNFEKLSLDENNSQQ